jgi:hypothetical protein
MFHFVQSWRLTDRRMHFMRAWTQFPSRAFFSIESLEKKREEKRGFEKKLVTQPDSQGSGKTSKSSPHLNYFQEKSLSFLDVCIYKVWLPRTLEKKLIFQHQILTFFVRFHIFCTCYDFLFAKISQMSSIV